MGRGPRRLQPLPQRRRATRPRGTEERQEPGQGALHSHRHPELRRASAGRQPARGRRGGRKPLLLRGGEGKRRWLAANHIRAGSAPRYWRFFGRFFLPCPSILKAASFPRPSEARPDGVQLVLAAPVSRAVGQVDVVRGARRRGPRAGCHRRRRRRGGSSGAGAGGRRGGSASGDQIAESQASPRSLDVPGFEVALSHITQRRTRVCRWASSPRPGIRAGSQMYARILGWEGGEIPFMLMWFTRACLVCWWHIWVHPRSSVGLSSKHFQWIPFEGAAVLSVQCLQLLL